jgi:hypothetical protein
MKIEIKIADIRCKGFVAWQNTNLLFNILLNEAIDYFPGTRRLPYKQSLQHLFLGFGARRLISNRMAAQLRSGSGKEREALFSR